MVSERYAQEHESIDRILLETATHQRYSTSIGSSSSMRKKITFNKSLIYDESRAVSGIIGMITDNVGDVVTRSNVVKKLTPRELDVLNLLMAGKSAKSIALALGISVHTAGGHMKSIYLKLGVHSKNEALYKSIAIFGMSRSFDSVDDEIPYADILLVQELLFLY